MNALRLIADRVAEARRDPALKDAETIGLELDAKEWAAIATSARTALSTLRKVRRISNEFDETREVATKALRRMGAL